MHSSPVPVEFNTSSSGGDDALSHRIFRASNQLHWYVLQYQFGGSNRQL